MDGTALKFEAVAFGHVAPLDLSVAIGDIAVLAIPDPALREAVVESACGMRRAGAGRVRLFGTPLDGPPEGIRCMGLVLSAPSLAPDLSLTRNLARFGEIFGLFGTALSARVARVLDLCDLAHLRETRVARFDSGTLLRAEIARAILHDPRLVIVDAAAVAPDGETRASLLFDLRLLGAFEGRTLVWVSPDGAEASAADSVLRPG